MKNENWKSKKWILMIILASIVIFFIGVSNLLAPAGWYYSDPIDKIYCTTDVQQCPDGSWVHRYPPTCAFAVCPNVTPTVIPTTTSTLTPTPTPTITSPSVQYQCSDGSWVNNTSLCSLPATPTPTPTLTPTTPTPKPTNKLPGFEAILALIGLIITAYIILRRKK